MGAVEDLEKHWFVHECALLSGAGTSPYGIPIEGERIPFKGFVKQSEQRVEGTAGQELVVDTTVICPLAVQAEVGDQVELPDPFGGVWEITSRSAHDGAGLNLPHHQRLHLTVRGG
ncbi:hypothetical protein ACEN2A_01880 [Corynebacterium auriscanis]|uniref:hypothetical protein n=1 Tax=Corynebacterium auriscanis TaxID=99807 RepID=UPI003CEE2CE3